MAGDAQTLFQQGVRAIRDDRDPTQGRRFLIDSLREDPDNDAAWVWLSHTVTDPGKKIDCLDRALLINPANRQALDAKQRLQNGSTAAAAKRSTQEIFGSPGKRSTQSLPVSTSESGKSASDLGRLIETVGLNKWHLIQKIIYAAGCIGVAVFVFWAWRQARPSDTLAPLLLVVMILPLLGVLAFSYSILVSIGIQVALHENGIRRTQGKDSQAWRWEDFTAVQVAEYSQTFRYSGIPVYKYHTYDCHLFIDKKAVLRLNKDIQKYREVGKFVTQKTTPIIFERNYQAHRNGETVLYGKVALNREGIRDGRRSITWDEIASWSVDNGTLTIKKPGRGKFRLYLLDIPNSYVLLAMMDKIKSPNNNF